MKRGILIWIALLIVLPPPAGGAPNFSEWGTPQNLGCVVNSPFDDAGAALSKNGLSLYFSSNRPDNGFGGNDIWVSRRASVDAAWGPPVNLGGIVNTPANEAVPSFSRDGHWMFFNSNRDGSSDIWASWRDDIHNDFVWQPPVKLGEGVNSGQFEAGASYFENESGRPLLFLGKGASAIASDIYVSELQPDGSFGPAVVVSELSSPQADQRPSVRFDGLEVFFGRLVSGPGNFDLMVSTRDSVSDPWGSPTNLGPAINTEFEEAQPHIAADRVTLLFTSGRPDGCGSTDLYMTTRTKVHGHSHDQDD